MKKKARTKQTRAKKTASRKPRAQKRRKSSNPYCVTTGEVVGFARRMKLTPAVTATLIKAAVIAEDIRAGGKGKLTMRKARHLAKKHGLNKKILAALEVRVRRDA